ncbi:ADP-ribosylation factor-like protein 13B isoform X2 [Palaemon carinicauda]|uniref:ADP-ribosylation factor-like protein 13B isoform X2 n=1 Tax=Palaemon carinicauda TaxID=392227 RepID=UPI0035B61460
MLGLANMGNCLLLLGLKKEKRPVTLLLVGLDNAGKTTAAKGIVGDPVEDVAPTVGFSPENIEYRGCEITIYDLGGGSKIRPVWAKYFSEVHGVIFVIDASAPNRIRECRDVLTELLSHKKITGKPVLVLANKQDVEGAMDEIDLVESLNVEEIVNKYKCPTRVETCSAITTRKNKPDKPIADGFRWLIDTIVVHYKDINKRVDEDMENERLQLKKELDERKERIRKLRAERERQEAIRNEQMARRAQTAVLDDSDDSLHSTTKPSPRAGSSGLPNGTIPQLRRAHAQEIEPETSNSTDAEELKELGFKSRVELQETTSSSSPQGSTQSSDSSESLTKTHQVEEKPVEVHKEEDPPSRQSPERHKEEEQMPPPPPKPHRVILVQESPTHLAASNQELSDSSSPSSATKDKDSGILEPNGFANVYYSPSKLELSSENRKDECVPIDSDDELFDIGSVSSRGRGSAVPFSVRTSSSPSTPSIASYIKEQLELESSCKQPKKKSFLKRYHKTAPLMPDTSNQNGSTISPQLA